MGSPVRNTREVMCLTDFNLSSYTVETGGIPQAYYIPEFISEDEEVYLLRQIYNAPKLKWKNLENRRLQVWGGDLTSSSKLLAQPLPPFFNKYPDIVGRLKSTGAFAKSRHGAPNHVIINEYLPLQGIMPHEDGPSYHPVVATISLRSHTVFHYYRYKPEESTNGSPTNESSTNLYDARNNETDNPEKASTEETSGSRARGGRGRIIDMSRPVLSLLLEPRSLVITTCDLYTDHLHGIDPLAEDVFLTPASSSPNHKILPDRGHTEDPFDGGGVVVKSGLQVANWSMIKDPRMREVAMNGGTLERDARISLTCRDVENVFDMKSLR